MSEYLDVEFDPNLSLVPEMAQGPRALVASVMLQAAQDAQQAAAVYRLLTNRSRGRPKQTTILAAIREGLDADEWMESEEVTPYSFRWCCDILGMDAGRIRDRLLLGDQARETLVKHYQLVASCSRNITPMRLAA